MPIVLQEKLIQWILIPLSCVTEKLGERGRGVLTGGGLLGLILYGFAIQLGLSPSRYLVTFSWNVLCLGLVILGGLSADMKPLRFSRPLSLCWAGITLCMLISLVCLPGKRLIVSLAFWAVMYPVLYLVWGGRSFRKMTAPIVGAVFTAFAVCMAVNIFFFPIIGSNYSGLYGNRNNLGMFCAAAFACFLAYLLAEERPFLRMLGACTGLGFSVAVTFYSGCRSGMLAMFICFVSTGLLQLFAQKNIWKRVILRRLLPAAAAVLLLLPSAIYVFQGGYAAASAIRTLNTPSSETPVLSPPKDVLKEIGDYNEKRAVSSVEKSLNRYTTGRVEIWSIYGQKVRLIGNPSEQTLYRLDGRRIPHAHNTILQMSYDYGLFAGIFFLLFNILSGLKSVRYAAKRPGSLWSLLPFAVTITYGALSVLEDLSSMTLQLIAVLYFLIQASMLAAYNPAEEKEAAL